jgi:hypothetical protein
MNTTEPKITHIEIRDSLNDTFTIITVAEAIKILESGKSLNKASWSQIVMGIYSDGRRTSLIGKYRNNRYGFYWLSGRFCDQISE